jgi:hypothetical protein
MWQPPITMKTAVTMAALAVATIVAIPQQTGAHRRSWFSMGAQRVCKLFAGTTRICRDANELWSNSSPANAWTPWAFARATGHVIGTIGSAPRNVRSLPLRPVRASPVALPQSPTASVLMTGCRTSATWYAMPSQRSIGASPAPANAFRQVSPTRLHGL